MGLLRAALSGARDTVSRVAPPQSQRALTDAALAHWSDTEAPRWAVESHWRSGLGELWSSVGPRQLALTRSLLASLGRDVPEGRVLEWGCGGGANAVSFAPLCREYVGVDISQHSLDECRDQVLTHTGREIRTVLVDPATPETVVAELGPGTIDLVVCFYVFELLPSSRSATQVLRAVHDLLAADGAAVIQIKYDDGTWTGAARRRDYHRHVAHMTTFKIHEFWAICEQQGLRPHVLTLVPEDELDTRYAYVLLTRSGG
ncbi:Methyltransferase domain protein [Nocardioides dokdonensis FR1436]|uniref:Methyltransferase domain protein n=1 Tax=Nocardioides dokdonensis FR1436 TaxID=1300347 RepID=A0A1A9GKR0_9ACTN|nr:Methyltransferase domain protein [Nocardioides dokdonensis FR1436]